MSYVATKNLPHLLFSGPPGVGKTASAVSIAREIFGEDLWRENFTELNASDERGIDIVRNKIKNFAKRLAEPLSKSFSLMKLMPSPRMPSPHSAGRWKNSAAIAVLFFPVTIPPRSLSLSSPDVRFTGSGGFPIRPSENVFSILLKNRTCPSQMVGMKP